MKRGQSIVSNLRREQLYSALAQIPKGCVMSYGALAHLSGYPGRSRWVGWVLSQLPKDTQLPWHRVVNARGEITCPNTKEARDRLKQENVVVNGLRVSLTRYGWVI
jgi:methylated-DNA-protein-cysteine methyltransferase-like protein